MELKALKHRQTLGAGVGPGTAETFEKVALTLSTQKYRISLGPCASDAHEAGNAFVE